MPRSQKPSAIVVHCSATKNEMIVPASVIDRWHKKRGWDAGEVGAPFLRHIGYHLVIQPTGEVEQGRPLNVQGAHCRGFNRDTIGICLIGNDRFTRAQFLALQEKIEALRMVFNIPIHEIYTHNDKTNAKTCPNMRSADLVVWLMTDNDASIRKYYVRDGMI